MSASKINTCVNISKKALYFTKTLIYRYPKSFAALSCIAIVSYYCMRNAITSTALSTRQSEENITPMPTDHSQNTAHKQQQTEHNDMQHAGLETGKDIMKTPNAQNTMHCSVRAIQASQPADTTIVERHDTPQTYYFYDNFTDEEVQKQLSTVNNDNNTNSHNPATPNLCSSEKQHVNEDCGGSNIQDTDTPQPKDMQKESQKNVSSFTFQDSEIYDSSIKITIDTQKSMIPQAVQKQCENSKILSHLEKSQFEYINLPSAKSNTEQRNI